MQQQVHLLTNCCCLCQPNIGMNQQHIAWSRWHVSTIFSPFMSHADDGHGAPLLYILNALCTTECGCHMRGGSASRLVTCMLHQLQQPVCAEWSHCRYCIHLSCSKLTLFGALCKYRAMSLGITSWELGYMLAHARVLIPFYVRRQCRGADEEAR